MTILIIKKYTYNYVLIKTIIEYFYKGVPSLKM